MYYCESAKVLLSLYNQKNNLELSMESFFYDVFVPIMFKDYDGENLMHVQNSPFTSPVSKKKSLQEKVEKFKEKIESGNYDGSILVGGPAETKFSATRSQFNDSFYNFQKDDIFESWIGNALSLMIKGGYCVSIKSQELVWMVFEGWTKYRESLNKKIKLFPNKINSWNTIYLLSKIENNMFDGFNIDKYISATGFETQFWPKVFFNISKIIKNEEIMMYCYQLGQQNKTIGFISVKLSDHRKIISYYKNMFGEDIFIKNKDKIEQYFGSYYSNIERACENGFIGYKTLRPKYDVIKEGFEEIKTNTYKTWIMILLKEKAEELDKLSSDVAEYIIDFSLRDTKTMKFKNSEKRHFIEDFLNTHNKNSLIRNLATLSEEDAQNNSEIVNQMKKLALDFDHMNIKMFMDLVKIAYYQKVSKQVKN